MQHGRSYSNRLSHQRPRLVGLGPRAPHMATSSPEDNVGIYERDGLEKQDPDQKDHQTNEQHPSANFA